MKKKIAFSLLILVVGLMFSTQGFTQFRKKQFLKQAPDSRYQNQAVLFVQGDMYLLSDRSQIEARFVLKNNDMYGEPVRSASVTINGVGIPESGEAGVYHGFVSVNIQPGSGCRIDTRIVTTDRREITSTGNIYSLLHMYVSNRFPRQPEKMDVGEGPVTIRWEFVPAARQAVDVGVINLGTNSYLFQQTGISHTDQVILPVGTIPAGQNIEIYVELPDMSFPIQQNVHRDSFIQFHTKTALQFQTFG